MRGWFDRSKPRRARGGIKARSTQGQIGESWWSQHFIETLEFFADRGRLARGRIYARKGQVVALDVVPGKVSGRVQGSRRAPYRVEIDFKPLTDEEWDKVIEKMADNPMLVAELLTGKMPLAIEMPFEDAGVTLFPKSRRNLILYCSCPDWGYPCKHVAAACYILAERFDTDPFAMFTWRGRSLQQVIDGLEALAKRVDTEPLSAASLEDFWSLGGAYEPMGLSVEPPHIPDHALRQIGESGLKYKRKDLSTRFSRAYEILTHRASALARDESAWVPPGERARARLAAEDIAAFDRDDLLDGLEEAYDHLAAAQRSALFRGWCVRLGSYVDQGRVVDASGLWRDKEALLDILYDEDLESLRAWLTEALSMWAET